MSGFDTIVMVDWSARSAPSPARPTKDAIFVGVSRNGRETVSYQRTRHAAMRYLTGLLDGELRGRRRVLVGFDFPFGYPKGFAKVVTGSDDPLGLWEWMAVEIEDDARNRNNRWEVATRLNGMFPGVGPFWGCPAGKASELLPAKGSVRYGHGMEERREVERLLPRAQPCWKLFTTGSVGSQVLMGLPYVQGLRQRYGKDVSVSPFEACDTPIVLAEIYPGLIDAAVKMRVQDGEILDAVQVRLVAKAFASLAPAHLAAMLQEGDREEGWILGLGHEAALIAGLD
ncbi:molybdopterin guanine dinucleotide synthesis [Gymnodinialimonas sp.]